MDAKLERQLRDAGIPKALWGRLTVDGRPVGEVVSEKGKPLDRYKSKAERYFAWKLEAEKQSGAILWWAYEPVRLLVVESEGKRCWYTPDFLVIYPRGNVIFYEVKGFLREAARLRFLAARERYPFWAFRMVRRGKTEAWVDVL